MNPHHPYEPPVDCQKAFGIDPISTREATKLSRKMRLHREDVTDRQRERIKILYDASVLPWDREVESIYHQLERVGEIKNTVVIATADHGELLGEDGVYGHPAVLHQSLLRVPLVFYGPSIKTGESDMQVGLIDLAPTVATLAGTGVPEKYHGQSLYKPEEGFEDINPVIQLCGTGNPGSGLVAGIDGNRKVVYYEETDKCKSYTLSKTAVEETPVSSVPSDLKSVIREYDMRGDEESKRGASIDQERLQADLQALGYLE